MLVQFIWKLYQEQYQFVEVNGKIIGKRAPEERLCLSPIKLKINNMLYYRKFLISDTESTNLGSLWLHNMYFISILGKYLTYKNYNRKVVIAFALILYSFSKKTFTLLIDTQY